MSPSDRVQRIWEVELQHSLSDNQWSKMYYLVNNSSICTLHILIQFKIVHRAHMSKDKLAHIFPNISPICYRCNAEVATLTHMFWSCVSLNNFWKDLFGTLYKVIDVDVQPNPLTAVFGIIPEEASKVSASA